MIKRINNTANVWKAILTLMVVYIHSFSLVPSDEGTLLYDIKVYLSFVIPRIAVPLFFIYSGYFFFKGKECGFRTCLGKMKIRMRTLLLPFFLWSVIGALFFMCIDKSQRTLSILEILNHTFWMSAYTPSSYIPQWVGYEIPKVTSLNMPLWYVRDLLILMYLSPLVYVVLQRKLLGLSLLISLWVVFLLFNTDKFPYIGVDSLLFFFSGAFLSYLSKDVFMQPALVKKIVFMLVIITSIGAFLAYGHQFETFSRHLYILMATIFILSSSLPIKIIKVFDKLQFGGVKCSLYIAHIL